MSKTSSILFVCGSTNFGGAGKIVSYVSNLFEEKFGNVNIISFKENESIEAGSFRKIINLGFKSHNKFERISAIIRLRKLIKSLSPDIIYTFVSEQCVMTRIATLGLNVKFISAERGDPYSLNFIWKTLTKWAYSSSDYCIFQTKEAQEFFSQKVRRKSIVIPNPFFTKTKVQPYLGERKKTIVSAGRFVPEKGFDLLIKAFKIIHDQYSDYRLIIYGKGNLLQNYQELANDLGISEFIEFPGYCNNFPEAIREDGIFVLSSLLEGIPNILLEAMSIGIPTVSSNCSPGGPKLLTNNGERGLLFKTGDVDDMTKCILTLIENSGLYEKLRIKGPEVIEEFSVEKISNVWVSLHNQLCNS